MKHVELKWERGGCYSKMPEERIEKPKIEKYSHTLCPGKETPDISSKEEVLKRTGKSVPKS